MPAVPHYPSDEPDDRGLPDFDDLVDSILNSSDDPLGRSSGA